MESRVIMDNNNILSYITWRGDLDFSARSLSAVDALVLACFSYLDLENVVSAGNETITVKEAAKKYFSVPHPPYNGSRYEPLLKLMAKSSRFSAAKLSNYVFALTDQTQFCALKIQLDDGTNFISFRGTDDTIVGWREDFEISFKTTPAQEAASTYLKELLKDNQAVYSLCGHSKGGNLAEYALYSLPINERDRISAVYTFDSPGLIKRVEKNNPKIHRFVPEFSIVGRLFEPDEGSDAVIVESDRKKFAQHDPLSWQVEGSKFVTKTHRNGESKLYNDMINQWIEEASPEERESLTNDLFDAFAASGSDKITELGKNGFGSFGAILLSLTTSSRRTRFVLGSLFQTIWERIRSLHLERLFITRDSIIGWSCMLIGIIALLVPHYAFRAFGFLAAITGLGWSSFKIIKTANQKLNHRSKRFFIITYLIVFACCMGIISNSTWLAFLAHFVVGIFLIGFAYVRLRAVIFRRIDGVLRNLIDIIEAILAFVVGILIMIRPKSLSKQAIIALGIFLIVYGLFKLIMDLFKQRKIRFPKAHK